MRRLCVTLFCSCLPPVTHFAASRKAAEFKIRLAFLSRMWSSIRSMHGDMLAPRPCSTLSAFPTATTPVGVQRTDTVCISKHCDPCSVSLPNPHWLSLGCRCGKLRLGKQEGAAQANANPSPSGHGETYGILCAGWREITPKLHERQLGKQKGAWQDAARNSTLCSAGLISRPPFRQIRAVEMPHPWLGPSKNCASSSAGTLSLWYARTRTAPKGQQG